MGRGWILCMPKMPDWGEFRMGVDISEPNTPPLVMLNVPPCSSSSFSLLSRARAPKSPIAFSMPASDNWSASRTTGTTRPRSVETAMPMS